MGSHRLFKDLNSQEKYTIHLEIVVNGHVDHSDVIGALFGQMEGLLGPELELKELQKTGKVGRIHVKMKTEGEKMRGTITVSSSLDRARTALLAAALETVDKVGPYNASVTLKKIVDERDEKRRKIAKRAVQIIKQWRAESAESYRELIDLVIKESAEEEIILYGPERLPASPGIGEAESVIVVEGRADVVNMMRYGWNNVISIGGAVEKVPETVVRLIGEREATAFVDGDRGGELVLRALLEQTDVDFVARAPPGKTVQDLTAKEIRKALAAAEPAEEVRRRMGIKGPSPAPAAEAAPRTRSAEPEVRDRRLARLPPGMRELYRKAEEEGVAILADEEMTPLASFPLSDLYDSMDKVEGAAYLVYAGNLTQRIVDKAFKSGLRAIAARKLFDVTRVPAGVKVYTAE